MGYCGIPSRACSNCRARRIKCNFSNPCGQCIRAGRPCDGARQIMDLMFRDQSKEVACKAQGIKQKVKLKDSAPANGATPECIQASCRSPDSDMSTAPGSRQTWWRALPVPAERQAVCFFFSNYVLEPSNHSKSVYDYMPAFYTHESERSALSCAVVALGLAGLSFHRREACLLEAAKSMYTSALHRTNDALRSPETAAADTTLMSVLLLGLYETNTCNAPPSIGSWLKHIHGATALLELRGKKQLGTELGRRLFTHLRTQIVNFCILRRKPIPLAILELSDMCRVIGEGEDAERRLATKMMAINVQLCSLRAKIGHGSPPSSAMTPEIIISEALSIAANLNDWHSELPPDHFRTSTVKIPCPTPEVHSDSYHIYRGLSTAAIMNNCRVIFILVHEIILTQMSNLHRLSPNDLSTVSVHSRISLPYYRSQIDRQIESSQKTILDLVDLICASVPFLLDHEYCTSATPAPSESLHPRAAGGNAVMWPLYVAAQIPFVGNWTRSWIIGRLNKIGTEMGVQQATVMATLLLQGEEVTDFLVDGS